MFFSGMKNVRSFDVKQCRVAKEGVSKCSEPNSAFCYMADSNRRFIIQDQGGYRKNPKNIDDTNDKSSNLHQVVY